MIRNAFLSVLLWPLVAWCCSMKNDTSDVKSVPKTSGTSGTSGTCNVVYGHGHRQSGQWDGAKRIVVFPGSL